VEGAGFALACAITVWSAALVKEGYKGPALMAVDGARVAKAPAGLDVAAVSADTHGLGVNGPRSLGEASLDGLDAGTGDQSIEPERVAWEGIESIRWFDGRPVVASRVIWMTVTAYTPGAESCWPSDDGMTATLHSVTTNAGCLVAADTSILPFGSLVSVDGYDQGNVVPVLDRGGKIRGRRLDLLMESVPEARTWGVRRIPVIVWEYADGLPAPNPREVR